MNYQQWVQQNQGIECAVCYGRGYVLAEDPSGAPTHEVACPYCHGYGHQGWIAERRAHRFDRWDWFRNALIFVTIGMFLGNGWATWDPGEIGYDWLFGVHVLLWLAVIAGWILWAIKRRPGEERKTKYWVNGQVVETHGQTPRHAPGFTDEREQAALGIFAAGVGLRSLFGRKK
jgi:hypothetical protein